MTGQEKIDEVMDHFDFDRTHKAMMALEWVWSNEGNRPDQIPDQPRLRKTARWLLKYALEQGCTTGTGGFYANYDGDVLSLKFIVEQSETEPTKEDCDDTTGDA